MKDFFCYRFLQNELKKTSSSSPKIKLIFGPRQSGKSTLLAHHLDKINNVLEINFQDRRLVQRYERDTGLLIQELEANPEVSTVFIDEIQKVPAVLDDIQYLFDKYKNKYKFYLTGSSSRKLKRYSSNLLPGRSHTFLLSPVIQAEQRKSLLLPIKQTKSRKFPLRSL